ncbi:ABC transporter substrate-binding protein [Galbibacter mesophilus]|uniref:ABC transporter substrate-binding protein n=1 Tax=Galbibacter mesophilus TaxID=379069 RepID=UPI00191CCE6B|nr:ABC transporter substrate-binding protein [Galbibacter mesophilus]MCM5662861.1 ABC transporter substrate-binding protein [Galbibacter mesophilus]
MRILTFLLVLFLVNCKEAPKKEALPISGEFPVNQNTSVRIDYAKGFHIENLGKITTVKVTAPWPNATKTFTYALIDKEDLKSITFDASQYDAIIPTPVNKFVATSTTHIPAIEALGISDKLVGFPGLDYISSEGIRAKIKEGWIKELGLNEQINTEVLLDLEPEMVMGFTVNGENKTYSNIQNANIPVVYNGDWVEESPLGKAEWIKFFGLLFKKEKLADSIFKTVASNYNKAKTLAKKTKRRPTVLSGSMFRDIWYVPAGESWMAQFLNDANVDYLWNESEGTGSLSLNFESVLEKAQNADYWIGSGQFTSYSQLSDSNKHYEQFEVFKNKNIYTFGLTKGETGGLLFYELAPSRPDIVLKDLIHILHPEILEDHEPVFFKPLQP